MLARLPALALVALGAVDALPVHEPEPLAPLHHHDDAARVHAKHGIVLDGLRELELDLEALTALAHRVKRAPSGPDGRPKLGRGGTLERTNVAASTDAVTLVPEKDLRPDEEFAYEWNEAKRKQFIDTVNAWNAGSNAALVLYTPNPDAASVSESDTPVIKQKKSWLRRWFGRMFPSSTARSTRVAVGLTLFAVGILFPPAEVRRSRRAARCTHRPLTRPFVSARCRAPP